MALKPLRELKSAERRAEAERERREAAREEAFRTKIAIQQFMNHNGAIFRAFARAGTPIEKMVEGEVLKEPAARAMKLAVLVASELSGKAPEDVTAAEAKPFRSEAAEWVATRWSAGKPLDVERAAKEIASAVRLADRTWDHDMYRDDRISDDASLMMTAASVAGSLARQVEVYDFRLGRDAALGKVVKAVVETASQSAAEMLAPDASPADKRNLTQTLARNLCSLMEACYERKAREVVSRLNGKPEKEKLAWYSSHNPVDEILKDFRDWTVCFAAYAVAASRGMTQHLIEVSEAGHRQNS